MIARHLIGLYVPAMALILTIDVSSNFLFSHMTIYSSFLRDGLAFGLAGVLFLNSRFNLRLFLSFFIILFILGILLGPMYLFYFVRLFIYLLLSLEVTRLKQNLNVFLFVPLFLLIAFFVFPNTEINQGFRFFIVNATVVGLILVCLHKLLKTRTKRLFTALGVFLTGSLAGIASLALAASASCQV